MSGSSLEVRTGRRKNVTFPMARRLRSKKNMTPINIKKRPKAVRPPPISVRV